MLYRETLQVCFGGGWVFEGILAKKPSFGWLWYSFACFLNIPGRQG
jgi:hypothetical protein